MQLSFNKDNFQQSSIIIITRTYFIFIINSLLLVSAYKHVILMHGLFGNSKELFPVKKFLDEYHPGTNISFLDGFNRLGSFKPLWLQVAAFRKYLLRIVNEHPEGVHLLCFSQGGLMCRGLLEVMADHNILNFISLSSPQAGQYGSTDYLGPVLPRSTKSNLYRVFYTARGQRFLSIANYWNDPNRRDLYERYSSYSAVINNETSYPTLFKSEFKDNFLRLKNLILIGGPDDGVIQPWQSALFGSYDANEKIIDIKNQPYYRADWFGLKTLDNRGSLHSCVRSGVRHTTWYKNRTVFLECIAPWLD